MKNIIAFSFLAVSTSLSAQSFVAGWDFDGVNAAAPSATANWGDQAGSAIASWTHSPSNPPTGVFTSEFGISTQNNSETINNSFSFLGTGTDLNTGFTAFSQNFNNTGEFGFQSLSGDDLFTLSFDGSLWQALELTYAFASTQGGTFSLQTVDLSGLNEVALAEYVFTPALNGVYDNFAITGTAVPEPSTFAAIFGVVALGVAASRRRRK